jgi:hypothetical protein
VARSAGLQPGRLLVFSQAWGVTLLLTYHIYRNGRLSGLTVDPVQTPMWPGSPIDSAEMAPLLTLGTLLADPDLALDGDESGGTAM